MSAKDVKLKKKRRVRSKYKIRKKITGTDEKPRISIFRSSKHIYAQVISDESGVTLASVSSLEKEVASKLDASSKSVSAAKVIGKTLVERLQKKNINQAVFDRNGFKYQGRVKAIAEAIRENGFSI